MRTFWLTTFILLAAALGAQGLGGDAIWYDEWWTLQISGGLEALPLQTVIARAIDDPWQPPLYYLLLWGWGALAGWSDVAARSVSWYAGLLAIPAVYRLGKATANERVGVIGAGLLSGSAFFLHYTHELRPYSLLVLTSALSLWAYWHLTHRAAPRANQALFLLSVAGLLYSHYFGALLFVTVGVYHLLFARNRANFWRVLALALAAAVLYLPWVAVPLGALDATADEGGRVTTMLALPELFVLLGAAISNGLLVLLLVPLIGGVRWLRGKAAVFALFVTLVNLVLALALNAAVPVISHVRYLLALWPSLLLLMALALDRLPQRRAIVAVFLAVWIGAGVWHTATPAFIDRQFRDVHSVFFRPHLRWDAAADYLHNQTTPGEAAAVSAAVHPWAVAGAVNYYFDGMAARFTLLNTLDEDAAYAFVAGAPKVWHVRESGAGRIEDTLLADYVRCEGNYETTGLNITSYALAPACCTPPDQTVVQYGGDVGLAFVDDLTPGESLDTLLGWASTAPPDVYSVALHVLDEDGELAAQMDYPLPNAAYTCHPASVPLDGLPPGNYTLNAIVYAWQTGERLTSGSGERVEIGEFEITPGQ